MAETPTTAPKSPREIARDLRASGMRCNCDLDNWVPERSTGHSWVCRIHEAALLRFSAAGSGPAEVIFRDFRAG